MYPWLVFRCDKDVGHNLETSNGVMVNTHRAVDLSEVDSWSLDGDALYYRVRTERDAKYLLDTLAVKTPGVKWGMFELKLLAEAAPGPVNYTTVNEKGVLPA